MNSQISGATSGPILPPGAEPIDFSDSKTRFITDRCRGMRVLDLGCVMHDPAAYASRYFLHRAIAEVAADVTGLDLHAEGVENLRSLGFNAVVGNAEKFAFDDKFDVIVAGDIIEHLNNLDGFLTSVRGALKPGGLLIVQTPNPWHWRFIVKSALKSEINVNFEHTCWFCVRTWRQLVARYDMRLDAVEFQSRNRSDNLMPLPTAWKHTSWSAEVRLD